MEEPSQDLAWTSNDPVMAAVADMSVYSRASRAASEVCWPLAFDRDPAQPSWQDSLEVARVVADRMKNVGHVAVLEVGASVVRSFGTAQLSARQDV